MVSTQSYPVMVGPYESWEECTKVREWLDWRAYETDDCEIFPYPQGGSQMLVVPYLPKEATLAAGPDEPAYNHQFDPPPNSDGISVFY